MTEQYVFNVRQLTRYLKALLAQDGTLSDVAVRGEISDFTRPSSGHRYFALKDEAARLQCVLFREAAVRLTFSPESGIEVIARGAMTVYEARGQYQLVVRSLERIGVGELYLAFERLRRKLAGEGLFDESRKRPLPSYPDRIALVTSPIGAAVHDVLTVLRQRWPAADVVVTPTAVSGGAAAGEMAQAIGRAGALAGAQVLLLVRGGGSMEELAGFNDERVARAIAACPIPVVTGIGHETDFTIADLVADHRAPTPTGAAVAAVPDRQALLQRAGLFRRAAAECLRRLVDRSRRELALVRVRPVLGRPDLLLVERRQRLDDAVEGERQTLRRRLETASSRLLRAGERLRALRPEAVLARGYSITRLSDRSVVRSARQLAMGTLVELVFARGTAEASVQKTVVLTEEMNA